MTGAKTYPARRIVAGECDAKAMLREIPLVQLSVVALSVGVDAWVELDRNEAVHYGSTGRQFLATDVAYSRWTSPPR